MVDEGYAATQILSQLHESIIDNDLNDKQKSAITEKMAVREIYGVTKLFLICLLFFEKNKVMKKKGFVPHDNLYLLIGEEDRGLCPLENVGCLEQRCWKRKGKREM